MLILENSTISGHSIWHSSFHNVTSVGFGTVPEGCILKQVFEPVPSDNKDRLVPEQVAIIINVALSGICLPICFLVSFITNLINMVVFCKQGLKERVNMCLFSLALLDTLYVAVIYGQNSTSLYSFVVGIKRGIGPAGVFFINSHLIGFNCLVTASMAASTVIALERCLCITRPLLVKSLMSTKTTALLLWSLLLAVTAGQFITDGLRLTLICVFDARDNSTYFQYYPTPFYLRNKHTIDIFSGIIFGSLIPGLCVTCVTVCTVIIVMEMKKLSQWRETVASASDSLTSRDLAVTRMIVGTSVLFVVCTIPSITVRVALNLVPGLSPGGRYETLYLVFVRFYFLASVINSSFNFFVYYAYGSKFQQTVRQLFSSCTCFRRRLRK